MAWGNWFVLNHSEEALFTRECAVRHLRSLPPDQLLAAAELIARQWFDADQLLRQASKRVAELEIEIALVDAPPLGAPQLWHQQAARDLLTGS